MLAIRNAVLSGVTLLILSVCSASAAESRSISIRNTDQVWMPGGICAFQFRLDNQGRDESFNKLLITLQVKDKEGGILEEGVMEVAPFGDSEATRAQNAFLETQCNEQASRLEVIKVTEENNGEQVVLPLSIVQPDDYTPLPVSVETNQ